MYFKIYQACLAKALLCLGLNAFFSFSAIAGDWSGYWEGSIQAGNQALTIGFQFDPVAQAYEVRIDVPQQSLLHYKASKTEIRNDSCLISFDAFHAYYKGHLQEGMITGTWEQNGAAVPLDLHKKATRLSLNRPQTPRAPFPYTTEELSFQSQDHEMSYGATFTHPAGKQPCPAIILITGSGQQDRDETIAGHKPFWVVADYLTRQGFAVLRIDDRGIGGTSGVFKNATTLDFAGDVEQAFFYLKQRPDVLPAQIGLLGHSEGGLIAPIVASRHKDIAFVVLMAGPGLRGDLLLREQNSALLQVQGAPPALARAYAELMYDWARISEAPADTATAFKKCADAYRKWLLHYGKQSSMDLFHMDDAAQAGALIRAEYQKNTAVWMHCFLSLDPQSFLVHTQCPVLALQGSLDAQVLPASNTAAIRKALATGGNKNYTVTVLPGLNHLFQHCDSFARSTSYALIEETIAPEALQAMAQWLSHTTGASPAALKKP